LSKPFSIAAYTQILTGAGTRLVLQAAYFAVLVNALTLSDYGIFASVLALSLILAGGGTFGFTASLFRAATTRRRILGAYLSAFLVYSAAECGVLMLTGLVIYVATFRSYLPLGAFLAVLFSEMVLWRLLDALNVISNGLGRYRNNIVIGMLASGGRLAAIVLFVAMGGGTLTRWTGFYVSGNGAATVISLMLFWPRVRLRWEGRILRRRLREAVSFWAINTLQTLQIEADKLIVLSLAGDQQAGIYALSMRVVELLLLPIKSFFPPYVQALLRSRDRFGNWRRSLAVEGSLAAVALGLFGGTVLFLTLFPHLMGPNVARALQWFRGLPLLPISRALLDYHREVMFAAERLATYAIVAGLLAATRLATIGAILMTTASIDALIWPINGIAVTLYVMSASVVWGLVLRPTARRWPPPMARDPV
jgi:O-antigen/teichoic acid export membrane protein